MTDVLVFYNTTSPVPTTVLGEPVRALPCAMDRPGFAIVGEGRSESLFLDERSDGFAAIIGRTFGSLKPSDDLRQNRDAILGQTLLIDGRGLDGGLCISTDASATIPAFVAELGKAIVVSSRLDWLLAVSDRDWRVDWQQILAFCYASRTLQNRTIIKGATVLEGGCDFRFRDGHLQKTQRWTPDEHYEYSPDLIERFSDVFAETVAAGLETATRPIVSLTAGFDSRLILAAALAARSDVAVGSWGTWAERERFPDNELAHDIAKAMGLEFEKVSQEGAVPASLDAFWANSYMARYSFGLGRHSYAFMEHYRNRLRGHYDIELDGTGAEVIKGIFYRGRTDAEVRDPRNVVAKTLAIPQPRRNPYGGEAGELFRNLHAYLVDAHFQDLPSGLNSYELLDAVQYRSRSQQRWWPRTSFITRLFPTLFAFRMPRVLDLAFRLPSEIKRNNTIHRAVIARLCPRLLAWPFQADFSARIGSRDVVSRIRHRLLMHFGVFVGARLSNVLTEASDWRLLEETVYADSVTVFGLAAEVFPDTLGASRHKAILKSLAGPNFFRMVSVIRYLLGLRAHGIRVSE